MTEGVECGGVEIALKEASVRLTNGIPTRLGGTTLKDIGDLDVGGSRHSYVKEGGVKIVRW